MVTIVGYVYTSICWCCEPFPVLLHDVMEGEWIASYVFIFTFCLGAAAFRVDRAWRGKVCLEDQAKACSPTDEPIRKLKYDYENVRYFTCHVM